MTPLEHYVRAEELLAAIDPAAEDPTDYLRAQAAQAHAVLAVAAQLTPYTMAPQRVVLGPISADVDLVDRHVPAGAGGR